MIFTTSIALALAMQNTGESVVAVHPKIPQTWTLEYPVVIRPYVRDYYHCLQQGLKKIDGETTFESQHRLDIPRCDEDAAELVEQSKARIARSKQPDLFSDAEVEMVFETIRQIHIARGRDIDAQIAMRVQTNDPFYDANGTEEASAAGANQ